MLLWNSEKKNQYFKVMLYKFQVNSPVLLQMCSIDAKSNLNYNNMKCFKIQYSNTVHHLKYRPTVCKRTSKYICMYVYLYMNAHMQVHSECHLPLDTKCSPNTEIIIVRPQLDRQRDRQADIQREGQTDRKSETIRKLRISFFQSLGSTKSKRAAFFQLKPPSLSQSSQATDIRTDRQTDLQAFRRRYVSFCVCMSVCLSVCLPTCWPV